jgi:hypothetical protein
MTIDRDFISSQVVQSLCQTYTAEYTPRSLFFKKTASIPAMLNAVGACGGFAAQVAVWRELVLPSNRNPGEFLVYANTKSKETFFFGEAINQFLFATPPDRLSFLSVAGAALSSPSELLDIAELAGHVADSLGTEGFGRPRIPPSVDLPELPRDALTRTWGKVARILQTHRPAEWPAVLGAVALNIIDTKRKALAPPVAIRILLEAAVPISKLNPATVEQSGVRFPSVTEWSMRALQPEHQQEIVAEVRRAMPAGPQTGSAPPSAISQPTIAFLNLCGGSCEAIVAQDQAEIGALFQGRVQKATATAPRCDVLFLYCELDAAGKIMGQPLSLVDVIRESGAQIAVVASGMRPEIVSSSGFQKSLDSGSSQPTNLVMVLDRKGAAFGRFFRSLFQDMWTGVPMARAWVKLAPQAPQQPPDIPGTICIMGAAQVTFSG